MQKSIFRGESKRIRTYPKGSVAIKLSKEQNDLLVRLADREDRSKVDEVSFLVKRRLHELDGGGGHKG